LLCFDTSIREPESGAALYAWARIVLESWIAPVPKATKISYEDDDYDRFEQHLVFTGA